MAASGTSRAVPQSKEAQLKSYQKRLKDDVRSMLDNYLEIFKLAKLEEDPQQQVSRFTQAEQDQYEMEIRAANIVRAGESLLKLVSDIKQFYILNEFVSVNEAIVHTTSKYRVMQAEADDTLLQLRDDMAADLYDLEQEYYSSRHKRSLKKDANSA